MSGIEEVKENLKATIKKGGDPKMISQLERKLASIDKRKGYINKQRY